MIVGDKNVMNGAITDKKEIEDCLEGHKEVINVLKKGAPSISELTFGNTIPNNYSYITGDIEGGTVQFTYKLKDGRTVTRDYGEFWGEDIEFNRSETYIKHTNTLFLVDPKYVSEIYFESYYDYDDEEEINDDNYDYDIDSFFINREKRTEFVEALKSDILTYGNDSGTEVGYINITYGGGDALFDSYTDVSIKSTYKKTLELLKQSGYKELEENIEAVNI
ncbi:MAG: hypothetical protein IJ725_06530 [Ruminococcus sp.]|nr:hypothetical protein [Ruminococcus sp.]